MIHSTSRLPSFIFFPLESNTEAGNEKPGNLGDNLKLIYLLFWAVCPPKIFLLKCNIFRSATQRKVLLVTNYVEQQNSVGKCNFRFNLLEHFIVCESLMEQICLTFSFPEVSLYWCEISFICSCMHTYT